MNSEINKEGEQCASRVELDNGVTAITDGIVQMESDLKKQITDSDKGHTDLMTEHDKISENNHRENCDQHGSTRVILWGAVMSLLAIIAVGFAYHFNAIEKADKRVYSLRSEWRKINDKLEQVTGERDALVVENEKGRTRRKSLDETIVTLRADLDLQKREGDQLREKSAAEKNKSARLERRMYEKDESLEIALGILGDNIALLIESETRNLFRIAASGDPDFRFTFQHWHPLWREKLLDAAYLLGSNNILSHIVSTEGWADGINDELVTKVLNKIEFQKIVENLPPEKLAEWELFVLQVNKVGAENVKKYLKSEYEMQNYDGDKDSVGVKAQ